MDIFVYSDESGVFDVKHNDYFVFGGLILLGKIPRTVVNINMHMLKKCCEKARVLIRLLN